MNRLCRSLPVLLIATFAIAIYANTLKNGFVYDDYDTIVKNTLIKNLNNLPKLIHQDYFALSGEMTYRPVVTFTYFVDHALYGLRAWGHHLTNIILHAANGVLLYVLLTFLSRSSIYSNRQPHNTSNSLIRNNHPLLISLLFVAHPVATEAVNAVSFREDLLAFFFYIFSFNIYLSLRLNHVVIRKPVLRMLFITSCLLYLLALLSKEMAATLPLIIIFYECIYIKEKKDLRTILFNTYNLGYLAVTVLYGYFRFYYLYSPAEEGFRSWTLAERFLTLPQLLMSYLKLTLFPVSLCADYLVAPVGSPFSISFIFPIAILTFIVATAFLLKKRVADLTFGIIFFLVALLPVYNLFPIVNPFAERYLYLPAVGICIIIGLLFSSIAETSGTKARLRSIYILLFLIILSIYAFTVVKRNGVWIDGTSLWNDTLIKMPDSSRAIHNRGLAVFNSGNYIEAIRDYSKAIELDPLYAGGYNDRGAAFAKVGNYSQAIEDYTKAIGINPKFASAYYNRGAVHYKLGNYSQAIKDYTATIEINPWYGNAYNNLGIAYSDSGNYGLSVAVFTKAIEIDPKNAETYYNRGLTYYYLKSYDKAVNDFSKAIGINPNHAGAYANRGAAYSEIANYSEAIMDYNNAIRLNPKDTFAFYNRGKTSLRVGKNQQSIDDFKRSAILGLKQAQDHLRNQGLTW